MESVLSKQGCQNWFRTQKILRAIVNNSFWHKAMVVVVDSGWWEVTVLWETEDEGVRRGGLNNEKGEKEVTTKEIKVCLSLQFIRVQHVKCEFQSVFEVGKQPHFRVI